MIFHGAIFFSKRRDLRFRDGVWGGAFVYGAFKGGPAIHWNCKILLFLRQGVGFGDTIVWFLKWVEFFLSGALLVEYVQWGKDD